MMNHRGESVLLQFLGWACAIWAGIATIICAQRGRAPVMVVVTLWSAVLVVAGIAGFGGYHRSVFRGPAAQAVVAVICALIAAGLLLFALLLIYIWNDGSFYG